MNASVSAYTYSPYSYYYGQSTPSQATYQPPQHLAEQPAENTPWYSRSKWLVPLGILGIVGVAALGIAYNWQKMTQKAQSCLNVFSRKDTQKDLVNNGVKAIKTEFKGLNELLGSKEGVQELVDQVVTKVVKTLEPQIQAVTSLVTSDTKRREVVKEAADAAAQALESRLPKAVETSLKTVEERYAAPTTWKGRCLRWLLGIKPSATN